MTRSAPPFLDVIADEQRWQLLRQLARSDRTVRELTKLVGRPQNLVSYHLGALRNAGVVTSRRSSADGRDVYYRVDVHRCADLLRDAGESLQPGLRLDVALPSGIDAGRLRRQPRVLFLCTGNSSRSQMAEGLMEHLSGGAIRARSAGSAPRALHANAVRVMAERGIDIAAHKSKHFDRFKDGRFDRVVTLCDRVREVCPEFLGAAATAHWSMADPAAEGDSDDENYAAFVRTAEELESRIPLLIGELVVENNGRHRR